MVNWQNAQIEKKPYVIDSNGNELELQDGIYTDTTPLSAENLNKAQLDDYSSSEQVIGTWTNGKPLYRRVIIKTIGSTESTILGTFSEIALIITMGGTVSYGNGVHAIGAYANVNFYSLLQFSNTKVLTFWTKANSYYSGHQACIILTYTKNTD